VCHSVFIYVFFFCCTLFFLPLAAFLSTILKDLRRTPFRRCKCYNVFLIQQSRLTLPFQRLCCDCSLHATTPERSFCFRLFVRSTCVFHASFFDMSNATNTVLMQTQFWSNHSQLSDLLDSHVDLFVRRNVPVDPCEASLWDIFATMGTAWVWKQKVSFQNSVHEVSW